MYQPQQLPPEILKMIARKLHYFNFFTIFTYFLLVTIVCVDSPNDKSSLALTSTQWYELIRPLLYLDIIINDTASAVLLDRTFRNLITPWSLARSGTASTSRARSTISTTRMMKITGRIPNIISLNFDIPEMISPPTEDFNNEIPDPYIPYRLLPLLTTFQNLTTLKLSEVSFSESSLALLLGPNSILRQQLKILHLHCFSSVVPYLFVAPTFIGVISARRTVEDQEEQIDFIEPSEPGYKEFVGGLLKEASNNYDSIHDIELMESLDPCSVSWGEITTFGKLEELSLKLDNDIALGPLRSIFETKVVKNLKRLKLNFDDSFSNDCFKLGEFEWMTVRYACLK